MDECSWEAEAVCATPREPPPVRAAATSAATARETIAIAKPLETLAEPLLGNSRGSEESIEGSVRKERKVSFGEPTQDTNNVLASTGGSNDTEASTTNGEQISVAADVANSTADSAWHRIAKSSGHEERKKTDFGRVVKRAMKTVLKQRGPKHIKLQTAHVAFKHLEDHAMFLTTHPVSKDDTDELIADILDAATRRHSARETHLRESIAGIRKAIKHNDRRKLVACIEEARYILGEPRDPHPLDNLKFELQRVRFSFFFLVTTLIVLSFSIGPQVQFFVFTLAVDRDASTQGNIEQAVVFFLQPFFLCFLALLGDELCDLVLDACDSPSLVTCRSMILAGLIDPRTVPTYNHCRLLSFWFGVLFEVVPLAFALSSLQPQLGHIGEDFWEGYLLGGMLMTALTTVAFLLADLRVTISSKGKDAHFESRIPLFKRIRATINEVQINPGSLTKAGVLEVMHVRMHEDFADVKSQNKPKLVRRMTDKEITLMHVSKRRAMWFFLLAAVTWGAVTVCLLGPTNMHVPIAVVGCVLVIVVLLLSLALTKMCPGIIGAAYFLVLGIFVLVTIAILISFGTKVEQNQVVPLMTQSPASSSATESPDVMLSRWRGSRTTPYSVCRMKWYDDLGVLDLAALANAVYEPSEAGVRHIVSESFAGTDLKPEVKHVSKFKTLPRWMSVQFHRENSSRKTWVIAVKGTSTKEEYYFDTELFATIKVLQIFGAITPILSIVPSAVTRWMLYHLVIGGAWAFEQTVWSELRKHIEEIQSLNPDQEIVLTGHSLGGCLAQVIAAQLELPALVFSSPGVSFSDRRFSVTVESLKRNVVVVQPENDIVPQVDQQSGTVQPILCRTPQGGEGSAVQCHSLVKTSCELWRVCGDLRGRFFSPACSPFITDVVQLGAYLREPQNETAW